MERRHTEAIAATAPASASRGAGTRAPAPGAARGRVWIVDDSKLETERAAGVLGAAHDIEVFADGPLMLERLSADRRPDVILLDWQMPGLSGIELCRFLREQHDEVTLPILMLTARGAREDFAEALAAGANDFVAKPYDDIELQARVRTLVRVHRQAEQTRERELWLRTTLSSIGEGVIATDRDGRVVFLNGIAEGLIGVAQGQAIGRALAGMCPMHEEAQDEGGAHPSAIVRRDGSTIAIERTSSPIGVGDDVIGVVYVLRDVTERTQHEAAVRARADFEEKLIGIVSHDLRNPLQAILLGAAALLRQDELDPRTTKSVLRIQRSADRATRLVSDVLDFTQARLGSGIPMKRRPGNLHELAAQVAEEVLAGHPQREVQVESSGAGAGTWDADRIAQVIANLLSNALKYGAPGTPVTLSTRGEATELVLEVHNQGAPIASDIVQSLFEPMKRGAASGAADHLSRSVGLGLFIVKHIVDSHGGAIAVRSTSEAGTTFSIRLPRS